MSELIPTKIINPLDEYTVTMTKIKALGIRPELVFESKFSISSGYLQSLNPPTPNPFFKEHVEDLKRFGIEVAELKPSYNTQSLKDFFENWSNAVTNPPHLNIRIDNKLFTNCKITSVVSMSVPKENDEDLK